MDAPALSVGWTNLLQQVEFALLAGTTLLLFVLESVPALRAHDYGAGRARHFLRNAGVWLAGAVPVTVLFAAVIVPVAVWLEARRVGALFAFPLPAWALAAAGLLLLDAADYLYHRLSHEARWLWRLHALHHTDDRMDVTTNIRAHPLHVLTTLGWRLVVLAAFGLPQWVAVLRDVVAMPIALWSHSNVRFPAGLDRVLRSVLVTPAMHRVHHSPVQRQTDSNYGSLLSVWDRAFGTYVPPPHEPPRCGLGAEIDGRAATLAGMLRLPWRLPPAATLAR